jgi:hypothetical protein
MSKNLSEAEFWWMVGILEGEGCFTFHRTTQRISLCMTDEDVIQKAAGIFTKITGKTFAIDNSRVSLDKQINQGRKEAFTIELYGENARTVMYMIVPHMSKRRRARVWQCLNGYKHKENTEKLDVSNIVELCLRKNGTKAN